MTLKEKLEQLWILVPAALLLVAGFAIALRSVDVRMRSHQGVRQLMGNLTSTILMVGVCLIMLMAVQSAVGYNLRASW
jgi:hypothetical protein